MSAKNQNLFAACNGREVYAAGLLLLRDGLEELDHQKIRDAGAELQRVAVKQMETLNIQHRTPNAEQSENGGKKV